MVIFESKKSLKTLSPSTTKCERRFLYFFLPNFLIYFNSEFVIINDVFLPKYSALNQANSKIIIINFISVFIVSCSVTKQLGQEEKLISKQTYELNGKKLKQDPITILSKTSVNKKVLGFPLKLMIYNLSNQDAEQDFEKWLNKNIKHNTKWSKIFYKKLSEKKFKINKPCANFFLMNCDNLKFNSDEVFNIFLKHNILLRKMIAYGIKNSLRVSIGNDKENKKFLKILENKI